MELNWGNVETVAPLVVVRTLLRVFKKNTLHKILFQAGSTKYTNFVWVKLDNDSQPHCGAQRNGRFLCLGPWKAEMQLQQKLEGGGTCMIRMLITCEI